jgi:hypothetical protein
MSQIQSNYVPKPKFEGTKTGILIQPYEIVQFFRAVKLGQIVDIKRGHFIGKSFKVIGKTSSADGNYLFVDPDSESYTIAVSTAKRLCSQCKRDADFACSCLTAIQKFN